jgi:hypothetical protein
VSTTRKPSNDPRPRFPSSRTLQTLIPVVLLSVLTLPLPATAADRAHSLSIRPRVVPFPAVVHSLPTLLKVDRSQVVVVPDLDLYPTPTLLPSLDHFLVVVDPVLTRSPTLTHLPRTHLSVVVDPDRTLFPTPTIHPKLDPLEVVDLVPTLSRFPLPHRLAHP